MTWFAALQKAFGTPTGRDIDGPVATVWYA
jgi:hypothetical protein